MNEEKETLEDSEVQEEEKRNLLQRLFVRRGCLQAVLLPLLAVLTALVIGAVIIAVSSPEVITAWTTTGPLNGLRAAWNLILDSYIALFEGSFGSPARIVRAIGSGETRALLDAFRPLSESLVITTPYIFAGLGLALGFRGGLFNIGAEGQLFVGGLASVYVGYSITGLPWYLHLPLAMLAGILAGALWGAIPGYLKARTGAHEVINTIMMNYVAFRLTDYLLSGPMARPDG
ncbi:MAG TPA: ABC transporter permease, partial [Anaerolineae bacterium]|nr:ABC transporter permease [Anaerolineae bacterium]